MKRQLRNIIVSAVALSMVISTVAAPEAQAAASPKLAKKASVKVGKKKKIKVKGVKAKKIKKTTWSVKKKKIVKLTAKKKDSVTVKGLKAGKTKLTAKIKLAKKTYKKTCTVTVTGAGSGKTDGSGNTNQATPTPAGKATPTPAGQATPTPGGSAAPTDDGIPTLRPLDTSYLNVTAPAPISQDTLATTPPSPTVDASKAVVYEENFDTVEVGTKTAMEGEKAVDTTKECPNGIRRWILRGFEEGGATGKDYLEVVKAEDVPASTGKEEYKPSGNVLKCVRDAGSKSWQGPMLNLAGQLEAGATYEVSVWAYSPIVVNFNEQVKPTEFTDDSYAYMPGRLTATRWLGTRNAWSQFKARITVPDDMYYYGFYFQSDSDGDLDPIYVDDVKITQVACVGKDEKIASIKDTYQDVFGIVAAGTSADAFLGEEGSKFIKAQYNAITPGNEFKPESILGKNLEDDTLITLEEAKELGYYIPEGYAEDPDNKTQEGYAKKHPDSTVPDNTVVVPRLKFDLIDKIIEQCHKENIKLRGHTLCWHEQMSTFLFLQNYDRAKNPRYATSEANMDRRLEFFVKSVLGHIVKKDLELAGNDKSKCVLYGYDAVNEYLHSSGAAETYFHQIYGTKDTKANPLSEKVKSAGGVSLRPKYVKETFQWAQEVLKENGREDVKMFYNDFNCYINPEDVVHLIDFINEGSPADDPICDGLGMQTHLTTGDAAHSADKYAQALECFRTNMPNMEIQVTEWDAGIPSGKTDLDQAVYYDQVMGALLQSKKKDAKITGITIWGLHDGTSWRADSKPCLFSGLFAPKAAFYAFIDAKKRYWS